MNADLPLELIAGLPLEVLQGMVRPLVFGIRSLEICSVYPNRSPGQTSPVAVTYPTVESVPLRQGTIPIRHSQRFLPPLRNNIS